VPLPAAIAEMDFGAAPPILDAIAAVSADANFGYPPRPLPLRHPPPHLTEMIERIAPVLS
jgi:hypothetical protein